MCYPQLLITRHKITVCKQPSTERHPTVTFLRLLTTRDTPNDLSHAPQMAFKRILTGKTYLNALYWHIHVNAQIESTGITFVEKRSFI